MYLAGNNSFNFVESEGFRRYVEFIRPGTNFPNRRGLETELKKRYDNLNNKLLPGLGATTHVSIILDC